MSSPPDRIAQSDVHEDAFRAIGRLAARATMFILIAIAAVIAGAWWRFT